MINNLIAFTQRFIFGAGLISITGAIAAGVYFTRYFHPVADISMLHCASMIAAEAELTKRSAQLDIEIAELNQREIDLYAREQAVPVCKKK